MNIGKLPGDQRDCAIKHLDASFDGPRVPNRCTLRKRSKVGTISCFPLTYISIQLFNSWTSSLWGEFFIPTLVAPKKEFVTKDPLVIVGLDSLLELTCAFSGKYAFNAHLFSLDTLCISLCFSMSSYEMSDNFHMLLAFHFYLIATFLHTFIAELGFARQLSK